MPSNCGSIAWRADVIGYEKEDLGGVAFLVLQAKSYMFEEPGMKLSCKIRFEVLLLILVCSSMDKEEGRCTAVEKCRTYALSMLFDSLGAH